MSFYADDWLTVHLGDCRTVMAGLDPESVHCVVTSPPYWGLRDYGTASWVGGDEACDHQDPKARDPQDRKASTLGGGVATIAAQDAGSRARDTCRKCGARRIDQQLGLEPTPEAYVESMVAVFREVRRVLRSDGTVWLNLGDSYAMDRAGSAYGWTNGKTSERDKATMDAYAHKATGLPAKNLVGIPWRVAFALQADGWYLRSDIIWAKPNPMPESVTDRPTKAHEYLFLLTKSARYWYDADAVREGVSENTHSRGKGIGVKNAGTAFGQGIKHNADYASAINGPVSARNLRSVWTVATQPYPGAHFATFPPKLIEPCIKAGCPDKVCPECGAPWDGDVGDKLANNAINVRPTCRCEKDGGGWVPVPGTVLDPFAGSGTTAMVANRLSRRAVLIDLNADYLGQVMDRNRELPLGLVG